MTLKLDREDNAVVSEKKNNKNARGSAAQFFVAGDLCRRNLEVMWYRLAAEQGHAPAQNTLGVMYASGHGVTQDYARAHTWRVRQAVVSMALKTATALQSK